MASACQKSFLAMVAGLTASGASAAPEEQQLEEVLVTARRTLENAQDVPVAVTVLPAERLANVTYATDPPFTGTAAGGATGQLADQYALFAPARTVQLQFTYRP